MSSATLSSASTPPQASSYSAPSPKQRTAPVRVVTNSRLRALHAKPASPTSTTASNASNSLRNSSSASETVSSPVRAATARGCIPHLPYNPSRPPPHSYTRQHEFPPFPPLARHPILPFLTTAFSDTQEPQTTPPNSKSRTALARVNSTGRQTHSTVSTIPTMDVSKNDPTALFIRPPLVVPFLHNSIDPSCMSGTTIDGEPIPGTPLTYTILHTHRNWFLDAEDFRKDNPNRIDYPHDLEPPRGWAPLSECTGAGAANRCRQEREKKEKNNAIRTKGSYAHSELMPSDIKTEYGPSDDCHEKTVLRCTFCRREYHGPNAKSMWRRHVFDKHKVAMKNRREGSAGMAPRVSHMQKKAKVKAADPSGTDLDSKASAWTLDLTNEENIIRLLERVISGNVDINLPAHLLNISGNGNVSSLEAIMQALRKSGIPLKIDEERTSDPPSAIPASGKDNYSPGKTISKSQKSEEPGPAEAESRPLLDVDDGTNVSHDGPSSTVSCGPADVWVNLSKARTPNTSPCPMREADDTTVSHGQKHRADTVGRNMIPTSPNFERTPLKDNTVLDRSNHNQGSRAVFGTPGKSRWKQNDLAETPGEPKLSPESLDGTPSRRHLYTPLKPPAALRSRALATTGEESYLTFIVSSSATASPGRGSGRILLTSPFASRTPTKRNDGGYRSTSDDSFGNFNASTPRYPFEFNTQDVQPSSSVSAFDPIPLELDNLVPAHWTPPSLGSPAPAPKPASRSISRASSNGTDGLGPSQETLHNDEGTELRYPDCSSPLERPQFCNQNNLEDFDMEAYLDLEDAGPVSQTDLLSSPYKPATARGLQFSKEYGLLSPSEVERIVGSAHPNFVEEVRSSKRRRVGVL